jgi:hypothetical protein
LINIINPDDVAAEVIVLSIGSHTIKYGLASQLTPFLVPTLIAYSKPKTPLFTSQEEDNNPSLEADLEEVRASLIEDKILDSRVCSGSSLTGYKVFDEHNFETRHPISEDDEFLTRNVYSKVTNDHLFEGNFSFTWLPSPKPNYLIGEDVMALDCSTEYEIHRPIVNGYLNVREGQSPTVCLDMLEIIIS